MEDKYIRLLKQAKEDFKSNNAIKFDEFKKRLKEFDIQTDPVPLWKQIYNPISDDFTAQFMTLEPYFQLLEYDELKEARKDSKQARKEAKNAMKWAIIALIVSSVFALIQIIK